jgi:carbamoyl-phosphate synthase large subunit
MPKRDDIHKVLIIGSGPIIIGQACEFDYSGTQACKALKEEGLEVILLNSNPATIMTDPNIADKTYVEPVTPEIVKKIILKEKPDALLPTLGGQTGLNTAMEVVEEGFLDKQGVSLIGADQEAITRAEDRSEFKRRMRAIGIDVPHSEFAYNIDEAWQIARRLGFPLIIRPSYTLGGSGGSIVHSEEAFEKAAKYGLSLSRIHEILIEECILGWKEYELEIMRDHADNVVIICAIENVDAMGVHTGDSITVAPSQTLTDRQYQLMRDAGLAIMREIGVETGGSNVQFAVNPETGRMVAIEMNPRVSRSSALASKATGFPIAKMAAKLAIGYTLDEIQNDITRETPASFEPTIDYCVVKMPRFTFEKFPDSDPTLGVQMKSVGETMAIGRTFKEALQKAMRGLEIKKKGFCDSPYDAWSAEDLLQRVAMPRADRWMAIRSALTKGVEPGAIAEASGIDPWFIHNMQDIVRFETQLTPAVREKPKDEQKKVLYAAKQLGFSDVQLAELLDIDELQLRKVRIELGIEASYKLVDTCAAEFEAYTPYYYSTYESEDEVKTSDNRKIMILGGGPNRIGQGIEFDYCCCQASFALRECNIESIMVNSNPETVSTDYDTSDKLYFEPLTFEDVMNIVDKEKPDGIIVQFGGQTPLNIAKRLADADAPIIGTSVESIEQAEDRDCFAKLIRKAGLQQPPNAFVNTPEEAREAVHAIGFPVLLRPSYVLGGRAMKIVYTEEDMNTFIEEARLEGENRALLVDKFISDAIEVDVDAVSDSKDTCICGIMEHIEEAGVHSGDSACSLPTHTLSHDIIDEIRRATYRIAEELKVIGLINIQYAIKEDTVYVLEVNPRASRTVPFVSKATGIPWAKIATKVMVGIPLSDIPEAVERIPSYYSVKESVMPFNKFPGSDTVLGPEMKSTGEVMGIDMDFGIAYAKSQEAASNTLPRAGTFFISVKNSARRNIVFMAKKIDEMGFQICATEGTWEVLRSYGIFAKKVYKINEGKPDIIDLIMAKEIDMIINVPGSKKAMIDSMPIRAAAVSKNIPYITTMEGAQAAISGMDSMAKTGFDVTSLQEYAREFQKPDGSERYQKFSYREKLWE